MAVNWGAFQTIGGGGQGGGQKDPLTDALKLAELRKQGSQGDVMALMKMMNQNKKFNYEKGFNQFKEIHKRIGDLTSQLGDLNQELSEEEMSEFSMKHSEWTKASKEVASTSDDEDMPF
mgnify:CR=1 FL=1